MGGNWWSGATGREVNCGFEPGKAGAPCAAGRLLSWKAAAPRKQEASDSAGPGGGIAADSDVAFYLQPLKKQF